MSTGSGGTPTLMLPPPQHTHTESHSTLPRLQLLQLQDALDGLRHVLHDVVGLHQRRVEAEVPVPVEHRLFDAVAGVGRHLRVGVVDPRADQDGLAGRGGGQRQLALPQVDARFHRGGGGAHVSDGLGALYGNSLLQVAVV